VSDYPGTLVPVNHVEAVPRRIRAVLGGETIVDTTRALYVWEWPNFPQYYIPLADVREGALVDEDVSQHGPRGDTALHGLQVGDLHRKHAAKVLGTSTVEGLHHTVRFEWSALDAWFEEDEQVFVHPKSPYARVDALRSNRSVRVELDGVVLAESSSPVLVFETGLPTRYYLDRTDVDFSLQGHDERLLDGTDRRRHPPRRRLDVRLPHPRGVADRRPHRLLQREAGPVRRRPRGRASHDPLLAATTSGRDGRVARIRPRERTMGLRQRSKRTSSRPRSTGAAICPPRSDRPPRCQ
jgi:uncharacterized protein (DUF427 family)